jgi:hypothetical protein
MYGGILNILIHENDIQKAIRFLDTCLRRCGDVHMDKLAITKALRSFYKNQPTQVRLVLLKGAQRTPTATFRRLFTQLNALRDKVVGVFGVFVRRFIHQKKMLMQRSVLYNAE